MNEYIWAECDTDHWPRIKKISAKSYNDAVEKVIIKYRNEFEDDDILSTTDDWDQFRDYMNEQYTIALSDLEIYEEI